MNLWNDERDQQAMRKDRRKCGVNFNDYNTFSLDYLTKWAASWNGENEGSAGQKKSGNLKLMLK